MKKETAINHLFQHGRLTATLEGMRQMLWGAITEVDEEEGRICFTNHHNQQVRFVLEDAKDFMPTKFVPQRMYAKLNCNCGCKAEARYICENCGATFCGSRHGVQVRDDKGTSRDLCDKCVPIVLGIQKN